MCVGGNDEPSQARIWKRKLKIKRWALHFRVSTGFIWTPREYSTKRTKRDCSENVHELCESHPIALEIYFSGQFCGRRGRISRWYLFFSSQLLTYRHVTNNDICREQIFKSNLDLHVGAFVEKKYSGRTKLSFLSQKRRKWRCTSPPPNRRNEINC